MSVASLLSKARAMGVRLILNGDGVKLRGPAESIAAIKPELAAHKAEIVEYLRGTASEALQMLGYPTEDGPFTPYCVPMTPGRAAALLTDLRAAIGQVADLEGWADDRRTLVLGLVARQPVSTLADDLAYFRERLNAIDAIERVSRDRERRFA
ncbi:hypothetical protein KTE26_05400 [Ralstonia mannitolilytica]|uniref:TubC N-terminal docking domain-related protein n=1 Tax=Ralstonia mannitolilytica TaxID=105219 RepID=UPI000CEED218|nr:hypothetical protein [Ralstonia mannitolilytica]MBU9577878.1 hypothetical protein [Ralstonia mannitolilytica]